MARRCRILARLGVEADSDDVAAWVAALAKASGQDVKLTVNRDRTEIKAIVCGNHSKRTD